MADTGDDEPYWVKSGWLAERYGISDEAVRKNIRRRRLGIMVSRDCGGQEWMTTFPLYAAWRDGDTGATADERRELFSMAERLLVP